MNKRMQDLETFITAYMELTPAKKRAYHRWMCFTFLLWWFKKPSRRDWDNFWGTLFHLVLPEIWRPALLHSLATLAALLWMLSMWRLSH